ncbi:TIGR04452 family lipoprotein [Leptospira langatensis]|uniref:TIGR04452 family lipoprotein n=1 Tax=Leptospira langatensis TaxID=2484983 RepID=A0A5F1ZT93_9LEPT|nr:TIGR04452 family lipoprotein [Leptospira langatensis]TGK02896.1 TIGR04452 family lipoprotein [Leptospira langatensis]TGL41650.1 TIGR04452 family lipoprotein [Leptospira langatensis]
MKKIITLLLPLTLMFNCVLFDKIGLSYPDTVSGTEAKNIILTSAVIGSATTGFSVLSVLAPQLAKVENDKYYNKSDVDDCANNALIFNLLTVDLGGYSCNLEARPTLIPYIY